MEEKIWDCILKRLTGIETEDSAAYLDDWLGAEAGNIQQYKEVKSVWELTSLLTPEANEVCFDQFRERNGLIAEHKTVRYFSFWKYGIAAALTGILLWSGLYFYQFGPAPKGEEWVVKKADAGKLIRISLPDSSAVWLNSASEISFSKHFNEGKQRIVKLTGEAYFDVKHDKARPFIVKSGKLTTTVYGTSFNIRAYTNESLTSVAVNSGKVGVTGLDEQQEERTFMLLANDKLNYSKNRRGFVKSVILNNDVDSWINGDLIFEQTPLTEVFETLSRKYNVRIDARPERYKACRLTARFSNQPVGAVLKTLRLALNIRSKQIGETIYLKGGNCM